MTHVTCRLTAKNRDQLRNLTLGIRLWANFTFFTRNGGGVGGTCVCGKHLARMPIICALTDCVSTKREFCATMLPPNFLAHRDNYYSDTRRISSAQPPARGLRIVSTQRTMRPYEASHCHISARCCNANV